ncbi:sensor histidine kinase [Promicromonospora sp. NPDC019610]|uniref:sensor histidine kinase n=1 Tax=Promicromonospora sp. NPDC019610 TaxID=3364405 RepID=UPI0037936127
MSIQPGYAAASAGAVTAASAAAEVRLTRSVSATWWYMAVAIVAFELIIVVVSVDTLVRDDVGALEVAAVAVGGLLWWLATLVPVADYRRRTAAAPLLVWRRHLPALLIGLAYGLAVGLVTDLWVLGALPVIQAAMLLNWPPGVRFRVVLAATALLVALALIDSAVVLEETGGAGWAQLVFLGAALPAVTVSSLWWWDVLVALDRARASEARLAATQERLRVATDVHDLQGHHLQVIALQLELSERLMPHDPEAGQEQLRAARVSVDAARQGTRDLATRFRSVPLPDELANAVDLLRAAGTDAEATVDPDAASAPATALGPVIRETTTNVLRHGDGRRARLSLTRADGVWRYEISNDVGAAVDDGGVAEDRSGAGLDGIARRAAEAGGALDVRRGDETFTVVVTVPADGADADGAG